MIINTFGPEVLALSWKHQEVSPWFWDHNSMTWFVLIAFAYSHSSAIFHGPMELIASLLKLPPGSPRPPVLSRSVLRKLSSLGVAGSESDERGWVGSEALHFLTV
jgi:hypothetical protein